MPSKADDTLPLLIDKSTNITISKTLPSDHNDCESKLVSLTRTDKSSCRQGICPNGSTQRNILIMVILLVSFVLTLTGQLLMAFNVQYTFSVKTPFFTYTKSESTFQYNLWGGAKELADNDMYYLAGLVYIWSGIWPYCKIAFVALHVALDAGWINPLKSLLKRPIDASLPVVQYLGKWAFLDVCVVMIIGVVLHVDKPLGNFGKFQLQTVVLEGQIVFIFGVALCLVAQTLAARPTRNRIYSTIRTPFASSADLLKAQQHQNNLKNSDAIVSGFRAIFPPILLVSAITAQTVGNFTAFLNVKTVFDPITNIMDKTYSIAEGFNDMFEVINGAGRLNAIHAFFGYIFVTAMPIIGGILLLIAWFGRDELREICLHWACILREWSLCDVYWLASIVSMYELPEISAHISDEFKDISNLGRVEISMDAKAAIYWLPFVMLVEYGTFYYMKTTLDTPNY